MKMNLTDEEQWRLLSVVRKFMEMINWAPASKLENGELAIPLTYLAKAANEASTLLKTVRPEERENWCVAIGWPGSTATLEAISQQIGISVSDMLEPARCFNEDYDAGFFAWEQTKKTNNADVTSSLFNKYHGNKFFWAGVYDSTTNRHWRPWIYPKSPEQHEQSGYKFDRPHQYTSVEIKVGITGETIPLNSNELPDEFNPELTYWRPL